MPGYYSLLRNETTLANHAPIDFTSLRTKVLSFGDALIANGGNKAFQTIMGQSKSDFIWGSNAVAMNQSIVLINAYQLFRDKKYINAALTNLDYVMGRNATGFCFVTGMGTVSPVHIHHRPSQADGIAAPVQPPHERAKRRFEDLQVIIR
jgi:endoglucanase